MKAAVLRAPGGLDRIEVQDIPDPGQPGPGQIRIALHATSLNYHDLLVANGGHPTADGRVLMSDGAGVVEAVGEGVAEFRLGDHVVSCFFPQWQDGLPRGPVGDFAGTPGDGIDGFAAHFSVRAATDFTHAPRGWSHAEAATITTAGVTAWRALVGDGKIKTGDTVLVLGAGGVSIAALQIAKMTGEAVIATSSSDEKLERVRGHRQASKTISLLFEEDRLHFEEHEERITMIIVWHVGSARHAFWRRHGVEGSLTAVECAGPVPEEFAGAAVQRTGRPILAAFESGQFAGHRPVDFAVILVEMLGIVRRLVENDELGHWYLLWCSVKLSNNRIDKLRDVVNKSAGDYALVDHHRLVQHRGSRIGHGFHNRPITRRLPTFGQLRA
jgi:NADPH:quinone reductase-like Zn-dependent oxidoreductase